MTLKFVEVEPQIKLIGSNIKSSTARNTEGSVKQEIPGVEKPHGSFEMYFSKALGRLLIYDKALLEDDFMVCLPCVRVQIQGKNVIYANTFANGYMKKQNRFLLTAETNYRRADSTGF